MEIVALILNGLAFLTAVAVLALIVSSRDQVRKLEERIADNSLKQRAAMLQYVDQEIARLHKEIEDLKSGCVPDYEKAKEAARAINDMNAGICNILGFDPMEAVRKSREEET